MENIFDGEHFNEHAKILKCNRTVDRACKGTVISMNTCITYGFEYSKDLCKINWNSGKISKKFLACE